MVLKKAFLNLPEERKKEMLDTAVRLYTTLPCESITVRLICSELNINITTFYRYFETKEDLYCYAYWTLYSRILEKTSSLWDMTDYMIRKEDIERIHSSQELQFIAMWHQMPDSIVQELIFGDKSKEMEFTRETIEREISKGKMRPDLRVDVVSYIYDKVMYLLHRYALERGITDPEEMDELKHYIAYDFLVYGLRGKKPENKDETL